MKKELIASISGIRGVVGTTLTPDVVVKYAEAFAHFPGPGKIIIGRDGRHHGAELHDVLRRTLVASGRRVVDIGICPTPTVQLAVEHSNAAGGVIVTASHNPQEWNGLKFVNRNGVFLNASENKRFFRLAEKGTRVARNGSIGTTEDGSFFINDHLKRILAIRAIDPEAIGKRNFKVVLDAVNASGSVIVPRLLGALGCRVVPMNCEPTGIFPRKPEPLPENITAVMRRVKREHADLGIVVDPDADRLVLVTERGEPFSEEYTIIQAIDFIFRKTSREKRIAVVNLSTTRAADEVAKRRNGKIYRSAVGEINVVEKMKKVRAEIGGEGSGGVILPEVHYGRDAMVGIALALQNLLESGGTLSELKNALPRFEIVKKKITLGNERYGDVLQRIKRHYAKFNMNADDGLKIDAPDYWVHFRKSNTEPILRVIAEARTAEEAETRAAEAVKLIERQYK